MSKPIKAVILAGGRGSRLTEETDAKPKPMIEIGGRPILWHIMKIYAQHGIEDFIICLGYKGFKIKEYFFLYQLQASNVTIELRSGMTVHESTAENWRVTLVETGLETQTGGRLRRVREYLGDDELFCMTYGDAVTDIDITAEIAFHRAHGRPATVAAVKPLARFGALEIVDGKVTRFEEKPAGAAGLISGGFFVLSPKLLDSIEDDGVAWEAEPMRRLAAGGELMAFVHDGFWQPMDTPRDRLLLDQLARSENPPWMRWRA